VCTDAGADDFHVMAVAMFAAIPLALLIRVKLR
jgi:hypothetical protein